METGLDLAIRETLLAVIAEPQGVITGQQGAIAELRQRVESLEARLSGGGLGARMPGHKPAARRKKPAEQEKKPRKKRQHGFARPRMEPAGRVVHAPGVLPRMPYHPERGLGAADPGGHRTSGVSCRSYRTRLHRPEVSACAGNGGCPRTL